MNAEADDVVRLQRAWRSLSADSRPQESCPDPERLWDAARGEAGGGEVRRLIEHTAACGACAEAWRLVREIDSAVGAPVVREPSHRRWRVASWGAVAAAAMVLLVVGLQWRGPAEPPATVYRGAESVAVRSLVVPETVLPRRDFVLRWQGPEGARYDLQVQAEDLTTVAEAWGLEATEYRVPAADLGTLPPGSRLYWFVEARWGDGETSRSKTFAVVVE